MYFNFVKFSFYTYHLILICSTFRNASGVSPCNGLQSHLCTAGEVKKTLKQNPLNIHVCGDDTITNDNNTHECVNEKIVLRHRHHPRADRLTERPVLKKSTIESKCKGDWFVESCRQKTLKKKNLKRRICREDWFAYYLKVEHEVGRYLSISVSRWNWTTITLPPERIKHSVYRIRNGHINVVLHKMNNGIKGKIFLVWSKLSRFDKWFFRNPRNIRYEVQEKHYHAKARGILEKVSRMCHSSERSE